jgi:hypothetical protein
VISLGHVGVQADAGVHADRQHGHDQLAGQQGTASTGRWSHPREVMSRGRLPRIIGT